MKQTRQTFKTKESRGAHEYGHEKSVPLRGISSSLDFLCRLPRLRSLHQVHSYEDLGSFPQLDHVDHVLQRRDREADERDELWPRQSLQKGKRCNDGQRNRRRHPVREIQSNEEELIACADEEKRCLTLIAVRNWVCIRCVEGRERTGSL